MDYDQLAQLTDGLSGREIKEGICKKSHMIASKGLSTEERKKGANIKMEHLIAAITEFDEEQKKVEQEKYVERSTPQGMYR